MTLPQTALDLLGQAVRLPLNFFSEPSNKVYDRFDALHRDLPDQLPEKRLFRH